MVNNKYDMGATQVVTHREDQLFEIFHENTKLSKHNEHKTGRQVRMILTNPNLLAMLSRGHLRFDHLPRIPLTREFPPTECSLEDAIQRRRSLREYTKEPLALEQVSQLLHLSYGVTGSWEFSEGIQRVRAAPSAGGLYPLEIYLIAQNVDGLQPGVYHYNVPDHALERLPGPQDLTAAMAEVSHYEETLAGAAALFVITGVFDRSTFKYGDRGYRFVWLDAGHMAQNMLLSATAMRLGAAPLGGFRDDPLSRLVGADGVNEAALYMVCVGHPRPNERPPRGD